METTANTSSTGDTSSAGNAQLNKSFDEAIAAASETLPISVTGQAHLNALRARPN